MADAKKPQPSFVTNGALVNPLRPVKDSLVNFVAPPEKSAGEATNFGNVVNKLRQVPPRPKKTSK